MDRDDADRWWRLRPALERVITRRQPFGPPDATQFTSRTELLRLLYDPTNRTHQQAETSGAPYVIGRKGAGKTAFVTAPKLDPRVRAVELPSADVYQGVFDVVGQLVRGGGRLFPEHTARLWRDLAWCAVLAEIARDTPPEDPGYHTVREFAESLGNGAIPGDPHAAIAAYLRRVNTLVSHGGPTGGVGDLLNSVSGNGWTIVEATQAGARILEASRRRYVLIVDSLEHYLGELPTTDHQIIERLAFEGLFRFVGGDGTRPDRSFDIRFAFPAEVWSVLEKVSANPIKDFHRKVIAHWSARELITLVGNRLNIHLHLYEPDIVGAAADLPGDAVPGPIGYDEARELLSLVLPDTVTNGYGGTEDTVAYLVRHTQLLPRHLITILNGVWEAQAAHDPGAPLPVKPIAVVEGVRRGGYEIVSDILAAFAGVHPAARLCCERTLPNLGNVFEEGELHRAYNQNGIRKDTGLEFRPFLRTLLEIGCIGRVVDDQSTRRYVVGEFEYTRAGSLHIGADEAFCVHPAFVEAFDGRHATGRNAQLKAHERRAIRPVYPIGSDPNDPHDYRDALW
ncbi:MAG TPA: hypothetical protein VIL36_19690 [Acidimicrobiales bacterium]